MFIMGVGIAPQRAHKQPFCMVTNNSFNNLSGILAVFFFSQAEIFKDDLPICDVISFSVG